MPCFVCCCRYVLLKMLLHVVIIVMYRCITIKDIQKNGPKTPVPPAALVRSRGTTELLESLQMAAGLTRT